MTRELKGGKTILSISQADLAQAVQFWLNEKVLKFPVKVTYLDRDPNTYSYSFNIEVDEVEDVGKTE